MPGKTEYGAQPIVLLNGSPIRDAAKLLTETVVHNHAHLPDMVELHFRDVSQGLLADLGAKYAMEIEVKVKRGDLQEPIFKGELTAMESEFDAGFGTQLLLRGYDKAHRLTRGRKTRAFSKLTFSDIARRVIAEAGILAQVEASKFSYQHIVQLNESNWDFLQRLARENDFEVVSEQGKVFVRSVHPAEPPRQPGRPRPPKPLPYELVLNDNLHALQVRTSAAAQVSDVKVRGWDVKTKRPIVAQSRVETKSINASPVHQQSAGHFGSHEVLHFDQPLESQAHATAEARTIAERIAASAVEVFGTMMGAPNIKAGAKVSIAGAGPHFDGSFVITSSRHVLSDEGYRTEFEISGRMNRSLRALGGGHGGGASEQGRISGVVVGVVTDNNDPEGLGRVTVKFPWLSDDVVSAWARIAVSDAGPGNRGTSFMPEVNDEVLVAFEHGDFRRPYVIGSLWNGQDKPLPNQVKAGKTIERGYKSSTGQRLIFSDDNAKKSIEIVTAKGHSILIDDINDTLVVTVGNSSVKLEKGGNMTLESNSGTVKIKGVQVEIEAKGSLKLKGATANLEASGPTVVKGAVVNIN